MVKGNKRTGPILKWVAPVLKDGRAFELIGFSRNAFLIILERMCGVKH